MHTNKKHIHISVDNIFAPAVEMWFRGEVFHSFRFKNLNGTFLFQPHVGVASHRGPDELRTPAFSVTRHVH